MHKDFITLLAATIALIVIFLLFALLLNPSEQAPQRSSCATLPGTTVERDFCAGSPEELADIRMRELERMIIARAEQ